jgi:hypothetical protein
VCKLLTCVHIKSRPQYWPSHTRSKEYPWWVPFISLHSNRPEIVIDVNAAVGDIVWQQSVDVRLAALDDRIAGVEQLCRRSLAVQEEARDILVGLAALANARASAPTPSIESPMLGISNLSMRAPSAASSAQSSAKSGNSGMMSPSSAEPVLTPVQRSAPVLFSLVQARHVG